MKNKPLFLTKLTTPQHKAATRINGPVLILAGAGTGKTSTIVARVLYMMSLGIDSSNILVMTFTNKAAREMKERVESQLNQLTTTTTTTNAPLMSTFHSFCIKFLKNYIELDPTNMRTSRFSIADEATQKNILGSLIPEKYLNKKDLSSPNINIDSFLSVIQNLQNFMVDDFKDENEGKRAILGLIRYLRENNKQHQWLTEVGFKTNGDIKDLAIVYYKYKEVLRRENLLDFDDLINLSIKVLQTSKEFQLQMQNQYKYIMVDEFQDTNLSQMTLLDLLVSKKTNNICVVGDELQSIYGWRGADIDFILTFSDVKGSDCLVVNLSKNFRSTKLIVEKANKLVSNSTEKHKDKLDLVAHSSDRGVFKYNQFSHANGEASAMARNIKKQVLNGKSPSEISILYRSRMILSILENALIKEHVPYDIYNGRALLKKTIISEFLSTLNYIINKRNETALGMALLANKVVGKKLYDEVFNLYKPSDILNKNKDELFEIGIKNATYNKLQKFRRFISELETNINDSSIDSQMLGFFITANIPMVVDRNIKLNQSLIGTSEKLFSKELSEQVWGEVRAVLSNHMGHVVSTKSLSKKLTNILRDATEEESSSEHMTKDVVSRLLTDVKNISRQFNGTILTNDIGEKILEQLNNTALGLAGKPLSESVTKKLWNDVNNIKNLMELMKGFEKFEDFMEHLALDFEENDELDENKVSLMTIHNSKGLEFDTVYLPGFNEDLIPLSRATGDLKLLEEEKRLAYVAITRAKRNLYISSSKSLFGKQMKPSRFLDDADVDVRAKGNEYSGSSAFFRKPKQKRYFY